MKSWKIIDGIVICMSFAVVIISLLYINNLAMKIILSVFFLIIGIIFLVIIFTYTTQRPTSKITQNLISELVLLSEQDTVLAIWDMFGKTALVIGRDYGDSQADVNLSNTAYESTVDIEHAVLNYSNGEWYIEDIGSENGISIKKTDSEKRYALTANRPCKVQIGDVIYIGLTKMAIR